MRASSSHATVPSVFGALRRRRGAILLAAVLATALAWLLTSLNRGERAANPLGAPGFALERSSFAGPVTEELRAGSYTYFKLGTARDQQRWVVALGKRHRGARWLQATSYGFRSDFRSARLGRSFERLYFVSISNSER